MGRLPASGSSTNHSRHLPAQVRTWGFRPCRFSRCQVQQASSTLSSSSPRGTSATAQAPPSTQTSPCPPPALLSFLSSQAGGWQLSTDHSPWETAPRYRRLPAGPAALFPSCSVPQPAGSRIKLRMYIQLPMRILLASALKHFHGVPFSPHARVVELFQGWGPRGREPSPAPPFSGGEHRAPAEQPEMDTPHEERPGCQPHNLLPRLGL